MDELHTTNGHSIPADWQQAPLDTFVRMEQAYQEINRRDSQSEARVIRKDKLVLRQWLVIVALVGAVLWLAVSKSQVKAFVQTVQVTEDGTLVQLGVPQNLYDYAPPDGKYMEMIAQWVRWTRWRGESENMMKVQWAWAYRHTCGAAHKALQAVEAKERASKAAGRRVIVEMKSVTRTAASDGYQAIWEEQATEKNNPTVKKVLMTATVTVGRVTLTSMEDVLENRLGICVNGYDISELAPQS